MFPEPVAKFEAATKSSLSWSSTGDEIKYQFVVGTFLEYVTVPWTEPWVAINEPPSIIVTFPVMIPIPS